MRIVTFGTRKLVNFGKSLYMRLVRIMAFTVFKTGFHYETRYNTIHYGSQEESQYNTISLCSGQLNSHGHHPLYFLEHTYVSPDDITPFAWAAVNSVRH